MNERASPQRGVLGLVTVGQSPRDDVLPDVRGILEGLRLVEHGALDGLSESQLDALRNDDDPDGVLATRLADGRQIVYPEREARPRTEAAVSRCLQDGASAVLLLCTGTFPGLASEVPVLYPDRILQNVTRGVHDGGPVLILTPVDAQQASQRQRWTRALNLAPASVHVVPFSPYLPDWRGRLDNAHDRLAHLSPTTLVFDCIGYTTEMRAEVAALSPPDTTHLLARTVAARVAVEIVLSRG